MNHLKTTKPANSQKTSSATSKLLMPLPSFVTKKWLNNFYYHMLYIKHLDHAAICLQRTGLIHTYPPASGHEAISVATGLTLKNDDIFAPYYRDHGALLLRNFSAKDIITYWSGDNRISITGKRDLPISIPIATQCSQAAGAALALKLKKSKNIVLCSLGDGATSKGDFYESLNFASIHKLPIIYLVSNNQWAISVPLSQQSGSLTIADKGIATGCRSIIVDGTDPIALTKTLRENIDLCREKSMPILIEALTYRLSDHTTADDASRYMPAKELELAKKQSAIPKLKAYMLKNNHLSEEDDIEITRKIKQDISKNIELSLNLPTPNPEDMFKYLYQTPPEELTEQLLDLNRKQTHHE